MGRQEPGSGNRLKQVELLGRSSSSFSVESSIHLEVKFTFSKECADIATIAWRTRNRTPKRHAWNRIGKIILMS